MDLDVPEQKVRPAATTSFFAFGLDVGQQNDPSCLAVVERRVEPTGEWDIDSMKVRRERTKTRYLLRYLRRLPLRQSYPDQLAHVRERFNSLDGEKSICIDVTGARAIFDLARQVGLWPIGVTISGGDREHRINPTEWSVPKSVLVSKLDTMLNAGELTIAHDLPDYDQLVSEFGSFRRFVSQTGHASYGAESGAHDDAILSVMLALWLASKPSGVARPVRLRGL